MTRPPLAIGGRFGRPRTIFVAAGERFGRLVVTDPDASKGGRRAAVLHCDCGQDATVTLANLRKGASRSCGCLRRDGLTVHGLHDHPLYDTWYAMIQRCENPRATGYANYGGRGIRVCPEWHDVAAFITWIETNLGPRPDGMTLDRYPDPDGPYAPGKVRWATKSQQRANQRPRQRP